MTVKTGQAVTVLFSTSNATTGALADADATPVGTLYVDGTANAATVTETNVSTGIYRAAVTLPALAAGQIVSLGIAATVAGVAGGGVVWQDVADTVHTSDVKTDTAAILVDTGTDGVKVGATQGAVTWGQQKISANVAGEGALHLTNSNANGVGLSATGKMIGIKADGSGGGAGYGLLASGAVGGLVGSGQYGIIASGTAADFSPALAEAGADGDTLETLSDQMDLAALEATLTAIKGAGWTTETLKALDTLLDAVKAKTDLISTATMTVVSPVNSDGDIEIDRGYDYYAADGRSLTWTDDTPATWPDLTGATATFIVGDYLEEECTITDPTGPATITLELSAANTELLPLGVRPFRIEVLLDNDHLILQIRGIITVHD